MTRLTTGWCFGLLSLFTSSAFAERDWTELAKTDSLVVSIEKASLEWSAAGSSVAAWTKWQFSRPQRIPGASVSFVAYVQRTHFDCDRHRLGPGEMWFYSAKGALVHREAAPKTLEAVEPPPGSLGATVLAEACSQALWSRFGSEIGKALLQHANAFAIDRGWKASCRDGLSMLGAVSAKERIRLLADASSIDEFALASLRLALEKSEATSLFADCVVEKPRKVGPNS